MGNRKEKKQKNKPPANWLEKFKKGWQSRYPVLFFVGGFALLMGVFYGVWLSHWFNEYINPKITAFNALLSSHALHLLGQHTTSSGESIYSPDFSFSVAKGCDGVEAMAIFVSALLTFPLPWRKKLQGVIIGVLLLFLLNLIRIISLFLTGVYYPSMFEVMHVEVWQVVFILSAVGLWAAWIYRSTKIKVNATKKNAS